MEKQDGYPPATIEVTLEPQGGTLTLPRAKTVMQLMHRLSIAPCTCLFIRHLANGERELLTPDRRIMTGDRLTVRTVVSSG